MKKVIVIGLAYFLAQMSPVYGDNKSVLENTNTDNLVDPTRPAGLSGRNDRVSQVQVKEKKTPNKSSENMDPTMGMRLHAIKISKSSRIAVINDKTLRPGEKLGRAKLKRINSGSVVMEIDERKITLSLLPDSIKKRPGK